MELPDVHPQTHHNNNKEKGVIYNGEALAGSKGRN